jgi:hypothetical protein
MCPFAHSEKELIAWNNWLERTPNRLGSQVGQHYNRFEAPSWCDVCQVRMLAFELKALFLSISDHDYEAVERP